jgi:hypothetical protein
MSPGLRPGNAGWFTASDRMVTRRHARLPGRVARPTHKRGAGQVSSRLFTDRLERAVQLQRRDPAGRRVSRGA